MTNRIATLLMAGSAFLSFAAAPAQAQGQSDSNVRPLHGDLNPFTRPLNPLYGDLNPFYGDIVSFWGDLNPFHGDINPFWGDINPFFGDINPFYGDINPFYGDINPFSSTAPALPLIGEYWQGFGNTWRGSESLWTNRSQGAALTAKMNELIARSETVWSTAIRAQTGKSFRDAFLNPLLARYRINLTDPRTLQGLSSNQRTRFFIDWYDGLMTYAGVDRVDHWMRTVNWSPAITHQQGSGADTIIGLLDATATGDPDIADNVTWAGGNRTTVGGHGVGVASLMVAAHDRQGVMGIAPNARVVAYNPFDSRGDANWNSIRTGILSLANRGASIINMSLGFEGDMFDSDWRRILTDPQVHAATRNTIFVMAAGNEGRVQRNDVRWNSDLDPNMIIVGSVRIDGTISDFSNTPGNACLLEARVCRDRLMNRFMVAPGELILVPDGQGGFVRRTGTSLAAPLVSGAIALLHDRWPWLSRFPRETIDVMLQSARDLGAPGVDGVYGHGMLDIAASQSPLSYDNLRFYEVRNGMMTQRSAAALRGGGVPTTWQTDRVYFHLYEPLGRTFRDFTIPVSSLLVGRVRTSTGSLEHYQRFAQRGFIDWLNSGRGFTDLNVVEMPAVGRLRLAVSADAPSAFLSGRDGPAAPNTMFRFSDSGTGLGFTAGYGNGALAFNQQHGLALTSDHGRDGGVNPLLALASGGQFMSAELPLGRHTSVSIGMTGNRDVDQSELPNLSDAERTAFAGVDPLDAEAMNVRIIHQASPSLTLGAAYARIREHNAMLGVQSRERTDFSQGATSETATVSASLDVGRAWTLAASATMGRTRSAGDPEQGFTSAGVTSTAWTVAATRHGVLGRRDALRLSIAQPLHVENGQISYRSVQVIDRTTGELGLAEQSFDANGDARSIVGELLYEAPILSGNGEVGFFGRAEIQAEGDRDVSQFSVGSRLSVRF